MLSKTFGPLDVESRTGGSVPRLVRAGTVVSVFRDEQGSIPANVALPDETPVPVLRVDGQSQVPEFGITEDDLDVVWLRIQGGPLTRVEANEPDTGPSITQTFSHGGVLTVTDGTSRLPILGGTYSVQSVLAMVGEAPQGADIIVDLKKNGTSIYGSQAAKPSILAGTTVTTGGNHEATEVTTGDYLTVDINQVGSTNPGSDLVVAVQLQQR